VLISILFLSAPKPRVPLFAGKSASRQLIPAQAQETGAFDFSESFNYDVV